MTNKRSIVSVVIAKIKISFFSTTYKFLRLKNLFKCTMQCAIIFFFFSSLSLQTIPFCQKLICKEIFTRLFCVS